MTFTIESLALCVDEYASVAGDVTAGGPTWVDGFAMATPGTRRDHLATMGPVWSLSFDSSHHMFCAESLSSGTHHARIQRFAATLASAGPPPVYTYASSGTWGPDLHDVLGVVNEKPLAIRVEPSGIVWVLAWANVVGLALKLFKFNSSGTLLGLWAVDSNLGQGLVCLDIDSRGWVYYTDGSDTLRCFEPSTGTQLTPVLTIDPGAAHAGAIGAFKILLGSQGGIVMGTSRYNAGSTLYEAWLELYDHDRQFVSSAVMLGTDQTAALSFAEVSDKVWIGSNDQKLRRYSLVDYSHDEADVITRDVLETRYGIASCTNDLGIGISYGNPGVARYDPSAPSTQVWFSPT